MSTARSRPIKQQTDINKQQYELDAANKKITEEQKKTLVQQADDQELASIKALYEQEKQLAGQKPAQVQEINNKIEGARSAAHAEDAARADQGGAGRRRRSGSKKPSSWRER